MNSYNNWGTVDEWKERKSILDAGRPTGSSSMTDDIYQGSLREINGNHDRFLDSVAPRLEEAERLIAEANKNYDSLSAAVNSTIQLVERCEENGNVDSISPSSKNTEKNFVASEIMYQDGPIDVNPERGAAIVINGVPTSNIATGRPDEFSTPDKQAIGSVETVSYHSGTVNTNVSRGTQIATNPTENFASSSGLPTMMNTTPASITAHSVASGTVVGSTSSSLAAAVSTPLQQAVTAHPEIRTELTGIYGFDIFNEDGTVNHERLTLALSKDAAKDKDEDNNTDLIAYLRAKYEIEIVDQKAYDHLLLKLEETVKENPNLGEELRKMYGFDIIKPDGSVDKNSLALIIINEQKDNTSSYHLIDFLNSIANKKINIERLSTEKVETNIIRNEVSL